METQAVREKPLISVIIPVCNVESYLEKCLDSVLAQTHEALEVILVDDASTDRSGRVCDAYARLDKRIRVVHFTENRGVSHARNTGLDRARGRLIAFVDADDYVENNLLERLYEALVKNQADISIGGMKREGIRQNKYMHSYWNDLSGVSSAEQALAYMMHAQLDRGVGGKLFERRIISDTRFAEKIHCGEDFLFFYRILQKGGRISYIRDPLYHYVCRPGSATQGDAIERKYTESVMYEYVYKVLSKTHPEFLARIRKQIVDTNVRLAVKTVECVDIDKKQRCRYLRRFRRNIRRYMGWEVLALFEHKKIAAEALLLYASDETFWIVTVLYKRMKHTIIPCGTGQVS